MRPLLPALALVGALANSCGGVGVCARCKVRGVAGAENLSPSTSIELRFELGTDLLEARQLVAERLNTVTPRLPTWASPPIIA